MKISAVVQERPWLGWLLFVVVIVAVFFVGLLAASIIERRAEAQFVTATPFQGLPDFEPRNAVWGQEFPRQFESYVNTLDTSFRSKYGGAQFRDMLDKHPEKVVLWAGYAFSREYNQIRGHYYAVEDIQLSLRTDVPQPGTCWTCKSTDVPRLMNEMGVAEFYSSTWEELGSEVINPIGCQDCHDPKTMQLRVTRPALAEAFERQGRDIEQATHQEMRSLVCAQCHVEYYFRGEGSYLTFPWDGGTDPESVEAYYEENGHVDWTHALSRAPMIKLQHPDYELFMTGIHARRGVACADCHMPFRREGGVKFTDHHIQSPLNNVQSSCLVCHGGTEQEMVEIVETIQDRVYEIRRAVEGNLARLHIEAKAAWDAGATAEEMEPILQLIRSSQFNWDWVAASHGASFHSPGESSRILARSLALSSEARLLLSRILGAHDVEQPVPMPDLTSKAALQEYIGLNMEALRASKVEFLEETLPQWHEQAEAHRAGPRDYVPRASVVEYMERWAE